MNTHEIVRDRILSHGLGIASAQGLHALSMGDLARELDLSRSGLFAHFATKESLQLAVLDQAAEMFVRDVIEPGLAASASERTRGAVDMEKGLAQLQGTSEQPAEHGRLWPLIRGGFDGRPTELRVA
jgi:AcrR family transcriptional regulator